MLVEYQMNKKILIKRWIEKIKNAHGDKDKEVKKIRWGRTTKRKIICVKTVEDGCSTKLL